MSIKTVGIVGLGDMGQLYAKTFARAGLRVWGVDVSEKIPGLQQQLSPLNIKVTASLEEMLSVVEVVVYSVEASSLHKVVAASLPYLRPGVLVVSQSAVKTLEEECFTSLLPLETASAFCHSLHGPSLPTAGQTLVLVPHRCGFPDFLRLQQLFQVFRSQVIFLPHASEHDKCMADIQAVTHVCFQSMGLAWLHAGIKPWEHGTYDSVVDRVKILLMLRIFCGKPHVYRELAFSNPFAAHQIQVYCQCVEELVNLAKGNKRELFLQRILDAKNAVFGAEPRTPFLLKKDLSTIGFLQKNLTGRPNSHLSLYAMVCAWHDLKSNPLNLLAVQTPPFRLRLDIAELVLFSEDIFFESVEAALSDSSMKHDDGCYLKAVQDWTQAILNKNTKVYEDLFNQVRQYFVDDLDLGRTLSDQLINVALTADPAM